VAEMARKELELRLRAEKIVKVEVTVRKTRMLVG
jgi:hypothetical protein